MKKYGIILIFLLCFFLFFLFFEKKTYHFSFFYFDTYIDIQYQGKVNYKEDLEGILKEYHELSSRYEEFGNNVYYIFHNTSSEETINIDSKLYDLLSYAWSFKEKSKGKLDIGMGCVLDIWKAHQENNTVPSYEELNSCEEQDLVLLENNTILNNHPNLDLGSIAKGYTVQKLSEFFHEKNIKDFIIDAGGNVAVGTPNRKSTYQIGIQSPEENSVFKVLNIKEKSVVTSGGYERFYEVDGKKYHHIIDPETKYPSEYMKSVTVISSSSALADLLSTTLFLMPVEEGKEFIKDYDVDVIWFLNDGEIVTTEGVSSYE